MESSDSEESDFEQKQKPGQRGGQTQTIGRTYQDYVKYSLLAQEAQPLEQRAAWSMWLQDQSKKKHILAEKEEPEDDSENQQTANSKQTSQTERSCLEFLDERYFPGNYIEDQEDDGDKDAGEDEDQKDVEEKNDDN